MLRAPLPVPAPAVQAGCDKHVTIHATSRRSHSVHANARNAHRFEDRVGRILSQGHDLKATFREQALHSAEKEIVGLSTWKGETCGWRQLLLRRVGCRLTAFSISASHEVAQLFFDARHLGPFVPTAYTQHPPPHPLPLARLLRTRRQSGAPHGPPTPEPPPRTTTSPSPRQVVRRSRRWTSGGWCG